MHISHPPELEQIMLKCPQHFVVLQTQKCLLSPHQSFWGFLFFNFQLSLLRMQKLTPSLCVAPFLCLADRYSAMNFGIRGMTIKWEL